jgi:hypothetical protein
MFPMGNIRQPLIGGDLHQLVCSVSVEGQIAFDHGPPFTKLHLRVCFSRKQQAASFDDTVDALLPRGRDKGGPLRPLSDDAHCQHGHSRLL